MSETNLIYRHFQHRIPTIDTGDLEAAAGQIFMMANRTHALLSALLNMAYNESELDAEQVIAMVEAAMGEANDIKAVANMMQAATMSQAQNVAGTGAQANSGNLFELGNRRPETQAGADRFSERRKQHTEGA